MTWREHASPIIDKVITEVGTSDMKVLRKALREAYPFGVRKYFPYKIWCDEIRVQLGLKPAKKQKETAAEKATGNLFEKYPNA